MAETFDLLYITTENGKRAPIVSSSHWHDGHKVAYPKHFSTDRLMEALAFHEDPKDNWVTFGCELIRSYENVEEAVSAMEKGKGARIPVTKKPYTPTQPSRPTVAKNKQKEHVVPGLEKAMQPPISLSSRKGLCDVTNKSKPRDQQASSKMECHDGNRKNVQDSIAVEVDGPLPVLNKTPVEEEEEVSTSPNNSIQDLVDANDFNSDDGVHGRGQTGSMDISNRTSGDSFAVNEPTPRTSTPKPNRNLQLSLTAGKRNVSPARRQQTSGGIIGGDPTVSSNKDLKKISRYLGKVLYEQKRNNDEIAELRRLYKKPTNPDTPPPKMDQLPVKNLADLKNFEESLADVNVVKGLEANLKSIGGEKKTAVKAAWMKVADDRVLREVNWKGRVINRKGVKEQKWGLEKTALIKHMISGLRQCDNLASLTDDEFHKHSMAFIRHAAERCKEEDS